MKKIRKTLAIFVAAMMSFGWAACNLGGSSSNGDDDSVVSTDSIESVDSAESVESTESVTSEEIVHTCVFEGDWVTNKTGHWKVCECGKLGNYGSHSGAAADCEALPVCTTCNAEYGSPTGHSYGMLADGEFGKAYYCDCGEYITNEDLVDFVVEVEKGRDPVVLQLSDTQIMNYGSLEELCYQYIRETVEASNPDLILITGDVVYGKFDPTGSLLTDLISFMESLEIPWAPVFGNHDNECELGVDWQCQQFEAAEYCLFKQRDLTGNGNYSVGIEQDGELLRVFYMLDSNGCTAPSAASEAKVQKDAGFGTDQILWYKDSMKAVKSCSPDTKFSMAYHIQVRQFEKAFKKYDEYNNILVSGSNSKLEYPLNLDTLEGVEEGDFGYIGRTMKGAWDQGYTVAKEAKELGVDSHFVGHEHCNSASIVLDGVRYQYGQKSSEYDRYNIRLSDGTIDDNQSGKSGTPLMGGTVICLAEGDGAIKNGYIYLCD